MPEIARFYGIIIKMYFKPRNMNPVTFTHYMGNTWVNSTSRHWT